MMRTATISFALRTAGLIVISFFFLQAGIAQKVVRESAPKAKDSKPVKEVKASDKGQLVPRVALTGTTDATTIKEKSTNLLVYNTAKAGTGETKVYPGYYHNVGTTEKPDWKRVEVTVSNAVKDKEK